MSPNSKNLVRHKASWEACHFSTLTNGLTLFYPLTQACITLGLPLSFICSTNYLLMTDVLEKGDTNMKRNRKKSWTVRLGVMDRDICLTDYLINQNGFYQTAY